MIFSIFLIDPLPETPQYDEQRWVYLIWKGWAHPQGRRLGEWVWVGRV